MGSILRDLARFTVELDVKKLPEAVRGEAALKIVDSVAAGIGAAKNEQILRVVEQYRGLAGNQKAGRSGTPAMNHLRPHENLRRRFAHCHHRDPDQ